MKNARMPEVPHVSSVVGVKPWARACFTALFLWASASGCGPEELLTQPQSLDTDTQELSSNNGLSANGLSYNGLSANGLSYNGLSANGLSANGLSAAVFSQWFSQDPALADMVMTYVVRCAVPPGQSRSYTDSQTGKAYTWKGGLGLAPDWANGSPANYNEQQLITACLLAHVNRYGKHVSISVLGLTAWGNAIPVTPTEWSNYTVHEACFFGNLFTGDGLFFGADQPINNQGEYLTRACGALGAGSGSSNQCDPLSFVGQCSQLCMPGPGNSGYVSCTFQGVGYRPLSTRMKPSDYSQLFP